MDVDEFLDKEIQAEKKEDTEEKPVAIEVTKEDKDTIKHYFELWSKISEEKFKWDSVLYAELNKSAEKVREKLDNLLPMVKREKDIIKQLIGKAFNDLERGKYESATRLYSEISDMRNSLRTHRRSLYTRSSKSSSAADTRYPHYPCHVAYRSAQVHGKAWISWVTHRQRN